MSETERFVGKIQLKPRLENETDKDYFERITGLEWEVDYTYPEPHKYSPENLYEALYEHNIIYYEAKNGKKGYLIAKNSIYEILEIQQRDIEDCYCILKKVDEGTYTFDAEYYNGGTDLTEMIQDEFEEIGEE